MRSVFAFVLVSALAPALSHAQQQAEPPKTHVEGRVLTTAGAPVPRASVQFRSTTFNTQDLLNPRRATTDDEGKFTMDDFPAGSYYLIASKPGFVNEYYGARTVGISGPPVEIRAGQPLTGIEIRMTPQSVISGVITDPNGDPVAGLTVQLQRNAYVRGVRELTPVGTNRTDDRGNYRIPNVPPGRYYLSVGPNPFIDPAAEAVEKNPGKEILVTTYYPNAVSLTTAPAIEVTAGADMPGMNIRMRRERVYTIRATAVDASGNPVPNSALIYRGEDPGLLLTVSQAARPPRSPDGRFTFPGLLPGTYSVFAPRPPVTTAANAAPAAPSLQGRVDVAITDEDVEIQVPLTPGVEVSGTIRAEAGAEELVKQVANIGFGEFTIPGFQNRNARPDANGVFRLQEVAPIEYGLTPSPMPKGLYMKSVTFNGQNITGKPLQLTSGGNLEILFSAKAADVTGIVRDEEGKPLLGAVVGIWPVVAERGSLDAGTKTTLTDAAGAYRFDNLHPGDYYVAAWDQIDSDRVPAPDLRAAFQGDAVTVKVEEGAHATKDPKLIPVEQTQRVMARLP